MKKLVNVLIMLGLLTALMLTITACGTASGPNQVHMNDTDFTQSSITIKKGESITLVNDSATTHVIENGRWDSNGNARPDIEKNAPKVDWQANGFSNQSVGPFNTAGTFHLYCTIHPNMNLTIIVK